MRRNPIWIVNFEPFERRGRFRNAALLGRGYRVLQFSLQLAAESSFAQRDLNGVVIR